MSQSDANLETSAQPNQSTNSSVGENRNVRGPRNSRHVDAAASARGDDGAPAIPPRKVEKNDGLPRPRMTLRELFRVKEGEDGSEDGEPVLDLEEPDDPSKPVNSIDGLAKRLKVKPEDVYKIQVPMANGEKPVTIGELKDRVGEVVDLDARELEFDTRRIRSEGELLRAQGEIRELMALIPRDKLSPELIKKVRAKHEATLTRERQLTLEHIPAWENDDTRTTEISGIMDMLADYGFDENFITTVQDHRAMKFLRDSFLIRRRIAKAMKDVKVPPRKGAVPPSRRKGAPVAPSSKDPSQRTRGRGTPTERDKVMALFNPS